MLFSPCVVAFFSMRLHSNTTPQWWGWEWHPVIWEVIKVTLKTKLCMVCASVCSVTESSVEPLKAQLAELDQAITDQLDLIAAVKSNVLRNDDKIDKMLGTVCKS